MHIVRLSCAAASIAIGIGVVAPAQAAPIPTLFSTGFDAGGLLLADNTIGDPHYTLITTPGTTTTDIRVRTSDSGSPIPPWLADNTTSRWIGPNASPTLNGEAGDYMFRTTFSLVELNPITAMITGRWSMDNTGTEIRLNGTSVVGACATGFNTWCDFSITSGFQYGTNQLDFFVNNAGEVPNPIGLRVEMSGTADVPEPASLAVLGLGLVGLGAVRRNGRNLGAIR
jgi:hypothetical protein